MAIRINSWAEIDNKKKLIKHNAEILLGDGYEVMEYFRRNLDTLSFTEMDGLMVTMNQISNILGQYVIPETESSINSFLVDWSQLKIKAKHALMNSRVVLC